MEDNASAAEIISYAETLANMGEIRIDDVESHENGLTSMDVAASVGNGEFITPQTVIISSECVFVEASFCEIGPGDELTYLRFCNEQNQRTRLYINTYIKNSILSSRLLVPCDMDACKIWIKIINFLRVDAMDIATALPR